MTYDGGIGTDNSGGTIFTIGASGRFFTLYSFCSVTVHCMDGAYPRSSVTVGKDGNLYGVTPLGATNGHGVIFKMTPTGKMTTLYRFGSGTHGAGPYSALVQLSDGNFYGTTTGGGQTNTGVTAGTVFRMTPGGKLTTLYNFCSEANCTDGSLPNAGVVQGSNGNLYGVTVYGGSAGDGVVYSLSLK